MKKLKILFLNPLPIHENWPLAGDFWRYMAKSIGVTFPQLAAAAGSHECRIYDGFVEKPKFSEYLRLLSGFDVVALSVCCSSVALNVEVTLKLIKKVNPKAKIILGGHHATVFAGAWCEKGADIVVVHEGEETFPEVVSVLSAGGDLSGVKGIVYWKEGKVEVTLKRDFLTSLDSLPMPRWDLVKFDEYRGVFGNRGTNAFIETSRGCSFTCDFCCVRWMWNYKQRYKSVERVIAEIVSLKELGVKTIAIADDNFGSNYDRDMAILRQIDKMRIDIELWMFCRADTIFNHPELIDAAAQAGLKEVFVGFETLDAGQIKQYRKNLMNISDLSKYRKVYGTLNRNNVLVLGSFISKDMGMLNRSGQGNMRYGDVCDIALHQIFLPLGGVTHITGADIDDQVCGVDLFYADRTVPLYKNKSGLVLRLTNILYIIRGLVNWKLMKMLFGPGKRNQHHRLRLRYFYAAIFRCMARVSLRKIAIFWYCLLPGISSARKQKYILNAYLNARYIDKLAGKWVGPRS